MGGVRTTGMNLRFQFERRTVLLCAALLAGCSPVRILNSFVPEGTYQREAGIAYSTEPRQKLDVYQPLAGSGPTEGQRPLVVFFYGGNWSRGEGLDRPGRWHHYFTRRHARACSVRASSSLHRDRPRCPYHTTRQKGLMHVVGLAHCGSTRQTGRYPSNGAVDLLVRTQHLS